MTCRWSPAQRPILPAARKPVNGCGAQPSASMAHATVPQQQEPQGMSKVLCPCRAAQDRKEGRLYAKVPPESGHLPRSQAPDYPARLPRVSSRAQRGICLLESRLREPRRPAASRSFAPWRGHRLTKMARCMPRGRHRRHSQALSDPASSPPQDKLAAHCQRSHAGTVPSATYLHDDDLTSHIAGPARSGPLPAGTQRARPMTQSIVGQAAAKVTGGRPRGAGR